MPHSHHSHSGQFCKHASGTLEEVVIEAIRQQFQVYGLTEHVPRYRIGDLYPEESGLTLNALMEQFELFLDEAHRLKAHYASQITLLVGLETEYITETDLDGLQILLEKCDNRVEYLVGSIHHVDGIPIDLDKPTYQRALQHSGDGDAGTKGSLETFLSAYFDAQYRLLQRFHPEIIGHFDLCRLYTPNLKLSDFPAVWEKVLRNVKFAASYGALFEFNAAAFRKEWETAYPGEDVVRLILRENGRFALSDDSHGPQAVGLNYDRLSAYLLHMDVPELWYLQRGPLPNVAGRIMHPARVDGQWSNHSFWRVRAI